jgi:hypothetical protein
MFDTHISHVPVEWAKPITEVVDTVNSIHLALQELEIDDNELLFELTKLVLQRFDQSNINKLE